MSEVRVRDCRFCAVGGKGGIVNVSRGIWAAVARDGDGVVVAIVVSVRNGGLEVGRTF